jgi:methylglutaconyl-CoA hydratase
MPEDMPKDMPENMPETSLILLERRGPVALLTLNSLHNRNALGSDMVLELDAALDTLEGDPQVRALVLAGGAKVFCSGADLKALQELLERSSEDNKRDSLALGRLLERIYLFPKPVVAAMQGHAIAGGAGLVSVCDLVIAGHTAKLGYSEVKLGFVAAMVAVFLLRAVGERRARELLLTGKLISADQALGWGLVNEVVDSEQVLTVALERALELSQLSGSAIAGSKEVLAQLPGMGLGEAMRYAAGLNAWVRTTDDLREGIAAFLEKRPAEWGGSEGKRVGE